MNLFEKFTELIDIDTQNFKMSEKHTIGEITFLMIGKKIGMSLHKKKNK